MQDKKGLIQRSIKSLFANDTSEGNYYNCNRY